MNDEHKFGWVALVGPPNAGKSTLMNGFVGQKIAIVTPKAQTTRNRISGILSLDNAQAVFLDTPGVHGLRGAMNRFLRDSALSAMAASDVVVLMADAAFMASKPDKAMGELKNIVSAVNKMGCPKLVAANKVDKVKNKKDLLPVMAMLSEAVPGAEVLPVSAARMDGTDTLLEKVLAELPQGPPMFPEDQVSTVPLRFMVSEVVREKLFMALRQELPYSTAVEVEAWEEEPEKNLVHIHSVIYVSRSGHKGMVIGKGGQLLKKIGTQARKEMEEMLEMKVDLKLWVKVREGWTEDAGFLRSIGLGE